VQTPPPNVQKGAIKRLKNHAKKRYEGKRGVTEIRGHIKGNHLFLEVVKETKEGLIGRIFRMGTVRGIARLARLDYLGPNKWKFLIYKSDKKVFGPYRAFQEGTIEECLDAAADVYLK